MKKRFIISLFAVLCSIGTALSQERINEFVVNTDATHNPMTIYSSYGATPNDGVVIVNSTIPNLEFNIPVAPGRIRTVPDKKKNRYVLIIQPNDNNYKQYTITINAKGFKQGQINSVVVKASSSTGYVVNPKHYGNTNADPLYVDGWSIYKNGKKLGDNEIKALFANTESYDLYIRGKGMDKKTGETLYGWMIILGSGCVGGGAGGLLVGKSQEYSSNKTEYWLIGGGLAAIGIGCLGLKIQSSTGQNKIQRAVDLYNNRNMRSQNGIELEYGLTGNGVCFSLLF
ncbi:MAG: hypothetical protein IJ622_03670 [Bacteroidales bacterium]|nr:hypothetical protein [Bacteroidales bacterium]